MGDDVETKERVTEVRAELNAAEARQKQAAKSMNETLRMFLVVPHGRGRS